MLTFHVPSAGFDSCYDLTDDIEAQLAHIGSNSGIAKIFVAGSTAGLTLMRFEPGAVQDLLDSLELMAPREKTYEHFHTTGDDNGFAHVRTSLLGQSLLIPFREGKVLVSKTHRVVLFDFDLRESTRTIYVDV